jgi:hypothetical protein
VEAGQLDMRVTGHKDGGPRPVEHLRKLRHADQPQILARGTRLWKIRIDAP